jgi:dTMP kinase
VPHSIQENFVVLEGLDGAGTTTQLKLLDERLTGGGVPHWATWEPTDGPVGRLLRSVLARETPALPRTVALLYAADRSEHTGGPEGILARSARGELVISDRYLFSSLAYQGVENDHDYVAALNGGFPLPHTVFFLDTPVEVCQRRLSGRGKKELFDARAFQERVRERYLSTFESFRGSGMRTLVIDGDRSPEEIHRELWESLSACR